MGGFEPPIPYGMPLFESGALNLSATSPKLLTNFTIIGKAGWRLSDDTIPASISSCISDTPNLSLKFSAPCFFRCDPTNFVKPRQESLAPETELFPKPMGLVSSASVARLHQHLVGHLSLVVGGVSGIHREPFFSTIFISQIKNSTNFCRF